MGTLEKKAREVRRRGQIQDAILGVLLVGGVVALGAVAGNAIQLLKYVPKQRSQFDYYTKNATSHLVRKGLASWVRREGKMYLRITEAGRQKLTFEQEKMRVKEMKEIKRRWDGRWRMVVFDVPERRRTTRSRLRALMVEVGFIRLQNSVWVYPYDCEDFIALLKANLRIGKDALYAVVEQIENDVSIRKHFNLRLDV